jgi:hypothetical protein
MESLSIRMNRNIRYLIRLLSVKESKPADSDIRLDHSAEQLSRALGEITSAVEIRNINYAIYIMARE